LAVAEGGEYAADPKGKVAEADIEIIEAVDTG
jgi:hypothetical protein